MPGFLIVHRILLALLALVLFASCSSGPSCKLACENLEDCGKLKTSRFDCVRACEEDPTVLPEDVRCFSDSSCEEMAACGVTQIPHEECWRACDRIYEGCNRALRGGEGPLSKGGCISFCRAELTTQKVNCLERMACNRIEECL